MKRRDGSELKTQVQNPEALQPSEAEEPGEKTEREQSREEGKLERVVAGKPRAIRGQLDKCYREAKAMNSEVLGLAAVGLLGSCIGGERVWEPRREGTSRESGQEKVTFELSFKR